ncbi:MAG TPA: DUF2905 domain-containing protein [Chitinophagales bacterium]|nr:DUF2905 domain-containing protein [Chitinophagales bacterium]
MNGLARILILTGALLVVVGLVIYFVQRFGGNNFRMPGDIVVQRKNFTFYFPVVTSIVVSIALSLLLYLFRRFVK